MLRRNRGNRRHDIHVERGDWANTWRDDVSDRGGEWLTLLMSVLGAAFADQHPGLVLFDDTPATGDADSSDPQPLHHRHRHPREETI